MAAQDATTALGQNDSRRRVVRTPIVAGWNGSGQASQVLSDNVGLAQHQIWWTSTGATAGTMTIYARPAKGAFFVPVATVNLATTPSGVYFLQALIDDVMFSISGLSGTLSLNAGINSVGIDFTPNGNRSLVDRRRFQVMEVASGWNGAAAITVETPELQGYSQHQLAIAGGVGNVKLQARPLGANAFVDINLDTMTVGSAGALVIFPGMYEAFQLLPVGGLTGSINAQINSIGQEMFFPVTKWQLERYLYNAITDVLGYVPANTSTFMSSYKNRLVNPNFRYWQRATSRAAAVQNVITADQWRDISVGTTIAPSQQSFTLGQTAVPYEPQFFHRTVVASVAGAANLAVLQQNMESVRNFAGQTCIVSFMAKADANRPIALELSQVFGTGGSPSAQIVGIGMQQFQLTTNWQQFYAVIALPSIAGKTLGTNGDDLLQLNFWFDAGSNNSATRAAGLGQQSGTFDFSEVQVEPDNANHLPTPFEIRPPFVEQSICERYCQKSYPIDVVPGTVQTAGNGAYQIRFIGVASNQESFRGDFRVSMRVTPTFTAYDDAGAAGKCTYLNSGVWTNGGTITYTTVSTEGWMTSYNGMANTITAIEINWIADAGL